MPRYGNGFIQYGMDQYGRFERKADGSGWMLRPARVRAGDGPWVYASAPITLEGSLTQFRVRTNMSGWTYEQQVTINGGTSAVRVRTDKGDFVIAGKVDEG